MLMLKLRATFETAGTTSNESVLDGPEIVHVGCARMGFMSATPSRALDSAPPLKRQQQYAR